MHVLLINSVCGIGSTGRIVTDLHSILLSQGHQSTIAYGRDAAHNCSKAIRIGRKLDNYFHVVKTRIYDAHGFGSSSATKEFIKKIDQLRPDVIHLHNLHGYYIHIGLLFDYLKKTRKPVIWTLHDCWPFTGHCSHYDYIDCNKWRDGCYGCQIKGEYPKSYYFDRSGQNYQDKKKIFSDHYDLTVVTPSKWLMSQVEESYLREYPVKLINNGIDLEIFKPVSNDFKIRYGLESEFLILGVASVWSERKGLRYFIELAKRLNHDEKIILVGLNETQVRQMPEGIIGIQRTRVAAELTDIYSAADVFVNPTLEDTYPTTNLEAMACGTPVITFNSGGSAESVKNGCGLVVSRGDLDGIMNAISAIKKNGKHFYAQECRQHALFSFNKNVKFVEYIELYRSVLRDKSISLC